jgi:hypothetical protein
MGDEMLLPLKLTGTVMLCGTKPVPGWPTGPGTGSGCV